MQMTLIHDKNILSGARNWLLKLDYSTDLFVTSDLSLEP